MIADTVRRMLGDWIGERCALCFGLGARDGLCPGCRGDLPWLPAAHCPRCALPTPGGAVCGVCLKSPPAFDAAVCAALYAYPLDAMVRSLKYEGRIALARPLGAILAVAVARQATPDLVLPMPLSGPRMAGRGFNQSLEIARGLGPAWRHRVRHDILERHGDAPPQAGLPLAGRRRNVKGAFRCEARAVAGRTVALLDDVMTSGATLDEAARTLKRAGAVAVTAWVVARTPRDP